MSKGLCGPSENAGLEYLPIVLTYYDVIRGGWSHTAEVWGRKTSPASGVFYSSVFELSFIAS